MVRQLGKILFLPSKRFAASFFRGIIILDYQNSINVCKRFALLITLSYRKLLLSEIVI